MSGLGAADATQQDVDLLVGVVLVPSRPHHLRLVHYQPGGPVTRGEH